MRLFRKMYSDLCDVVSKSQCLCNNISVKPVGSSSQLGSLDVVCEDRADFIELMMSRSAVVLGCSGLSGYNY